MTKTSTASLFATLILFSSQGAFAQVDEAAPCPAGPPTVLCYGDLARCSLSSPSQSDAYVFFGRAGETVQITVSGRSNDLDPAIDVWQGGVQQMPPPSTSCSAGQFSKCSFGTEFMLLVDGEYSVFVSDAGGNNTGTYEILIDRLVPESPVTEVVLGSSTAFVATMEFAVDQDWCRFDVDPASVVRITASGRTNDLDCAITLYDSDGLEIETSSCSAGQFATCTTSILTLPLTRGGTYYVRVRDAGANNTGRIDVGVQCIFSPTGSCPPPSPNMSIGTTYCVSDVNSTGMPAQITAEGTEVIDRNRLHLEVTNVPRGTFGLFFFGPNPGAGSPIQGSQGLLCVDSPLLRYRTVKACHGQNARERIDLLGGQGSGWIAPGSTLHFQFWFRDGATSNTSDAVQVTLL